MSYHGRLCELITHEGRVPAVAALTGRQSIRRQLNAVGRGASAAVRGASPLRCGPLMLSLGYPRVRA